MSRSFRIYLLYSLACFVLILLAHGAKADQQRLFYCESSGSYYPTAQTCSVPWKEFDKIASATPMPDSTQPAQHKVIAYPIGMPAPTNAVQTQVQAPAPAAAAPVVLTPAVATVVSPGELATSSGPVTYIYGAETTPLMVCAVSQLCDMALQPGEKINHIILGDPEHWKVEVMEEGSGGAETLHLIIRPATVDLATSMIVLTKARSYHVQLQSHRKDYMMQVAFSYPEAQTAAAAPAPVAAAAPAAAAQSEAAVDTDDGFVKVGGITYVKGREPKSLAEPPAPAAVPRPEVSMTP